MTRLPGLGPRGEGWVVIQLLLLGAIALAGFMAGSVWGGTLATVSAVVGVGLLIAGLALLLRGLVDLGSSLTPMPKPLDDATLIETGAYALVRHPLYSGLTIGSFGWALLSASLVALLLAVVLGVFFDLKARREEAWLVAHYETYPDYMSRTRRLIPWVY